MSLRDPNALILLARETTQLLGLLAILRPDLPYQFSREELRSAAAAVCLGRRREQQRHPADPVPVETR